jgi:hypothetical protein
LGFHAYGIGGNVDTYGLPGAVTARQSYPMMMTEFDPDPWASCSTYTKNDIDRKNKEFTKAINWFEENKFSWILLKYDWFVRECGKVPVTWPADPYYN